jgi:hypothetical protein
LDADELVSTSSEPPIEKPPIENRHIDSGEKDTDKNRTYERQTNRPHCPRCNQLMTCVQTRGPISYYTCAIEECPERGRIPVARKEVVDMLSGKMNRNADTIEQTNVAARDDMKGTE